MKKPVVRSPARSRKPSPAPKPAAPPRKPAAPPRKPAPVPPARAVKSDGAPDAGVQALRAELEKVRKAVEALAVPASEPSAGLEQATVELRRMLGDMIEREMEPVAAAVARLRAEVASGATAGQIAERLDALMADLGANRFDARPMDELDPLIHLVAGERQRADLPDGVVVESLRPGFRTARGAVLAKAAVIVNRRA